MRHSTSIKSLWSSGIMVVFLATSVTHAESRNDNIHEEAYLHLNTTLFLAGETILFSGYCLSAKNHKLSGMSKIMYVELLNTDNEPVFQTKISLDNGVGSGEYFINSLTNTGQYTMIAYTRWMRNTGDFFYQPITIINPFEPYTALPKDNKVWASFYPEGGSLIEGASNIIVSHVRNTYGQNLNLAGRLVNNEGEKILDFSSGPTGISRIEFLFETGQSYQVILEDGEGSFHFFKLGSPACGASVEVSMDESQFFIGTKCCSAMHGNNAILELRSKHEIFIRKTISLGEKYTFEQAEFTSGIWQAVLKSVEGEVLSHRVFHIAGDRLPSPNNNYGVYTKRQKVVLSYEFESNANLSISVRKKNLPIGFERTDISGFIEKVTDLTIENSRGQSLLSNATDIYLDNLLIMSSLKEHDQFNPAGIVSFLPEYRHDLIEGELRNREGEIITDKFVSLSMPGKEFRIAIGRTDQSGRFLIPVVPEKRNRLSFLKVLEEDSFSYDINFVPEFKENYPLFYNRPLVLDSQSIADIVQKSIDNQVENAYFEWTTSVKEIPGKPFQTHFTYDSEFFLDDFTRFPSMREVFHEYIPLVSVSKDENNYNLNHRIPDLPLTFRRRNSLVLLEGVPVSSRQVLSLDPDKIEKIRLANNRYYIGPYVADGVVSLHTYEGDLYGSKLDKTTFKYEYAGLQPRRVYTFPDYTTEANEKFPDKREQLYWAPEVGARKKEPLRLEFFTSDITGDFEIQIEGVDNQGKLISIREDFRVQ